MLYVLGDDNRPFGYTLANGLRRYSLGGSGLFHGLGSLTLPGIF